MRCCVRVPSRLSARSLAQIKSNRIEFFKRNDKPLSDCGRKKMGHFVRQNKIRKKSGSELKGDKNESADLGIKERL